jgi:hypothetical protein
MAIAWSYLRIIVIPYLRLLLRTVLRGAREGPSVIALEPVSYHSQSSQVQLTSTQLNSNPPPIFYPAPGLPYAHPPLAP